MKKNSVVLLFGLLAIPLHLLAAPLGTAFTYQGRLMDGTNLANGEYDLRFALFDSLSGTNPIGVLEFIGEDIQEGHLLRQLDFGPNALNGEARWLEISIRRYDRGDPYTRLFGRQQLFPVPYALMAASVPRFLTLGKPASGGSLDIYGDDAFRTIRLNGDPGVISLFSGVDGLENIRLHGGTGELVLFDNLTNDMTVRLTSGAGFGTFPIESGGMLELFSTSILFNPSSVRARITADSNGGNVDLFGGGQRTARLNGTLGTLSLGPPNNSSLTLGAGFGDSSLVLNSFDGLPRVQLQSRILATPSGNLGFGELRLFDHVGTNNTVTLSATTNSGGLFELRNANGGPSISANGGSDQISIYRGTDGAEIVRMFNFGNSGNLTLYDNLNHDTTVWLSAGGDGGAFLNLNSSNAQQRARLSGANAGGSLQLNNGTGALSVDVRSQFSAGNTAAWVGLNDNGSDRITFAARNGSTGTGGLIGVKNGSAGNTILLTGDTGGGHSRIGMFNASGVEVIQLHASHTAGKGRIVTPVLEITAGADLSEQFDVTSSDSKVQPGMVVCIDPQNPGKLVMSTRSYDRTVAGIVSGAGGVSPGMLMGQQGTVADGKHPVALTGRVYCLADATDACIQPGDLLTSSDIPGHSMKVTDHAKAQGAIIGKAMTALESGKGLVLVLVSLQ